MDKQTCLNPVLWLWAVNEKSYAKDRTHFYLTIYEVDTIQQHLQLSRARVHFKHTVMDGDHLPVPKDAFRQI